MQGSSVLIPPALGTFGTEGRYQFRNSPFKNWDFSVFKDFKFRERLTAQFRVEFFNVLNHPNFAGAGGNPNSPATPGGNGGFGQQSSTPDVSATNAILGSGGPRSMQLGLKLIF
jgi:hypothetical protein